MNLHTGDDEHRLAPGMARSMAEEARLDREFGRGEGIACMAVATVDLD